MTHQPSPGTANAVRGPTVRTTTIPPAQPARLLFPSTQVDYGQTLTAADRERARHAMRALRLAADRIEEALDSNRAADLLEATEIGADAGQVSVQVAALLGRKS